MRVLTISDTHIRPAQPTEHASLVTLWERSVRATHDFLTEADIALYRPLVAEYFESSAGDLWVLTDEADLPIGFSVSLATQSPRCSWTPRTVEEGVGDVWCRTHRNCEVSHSPLM
jgi:putative acetyltransferase